VKTSDLDPAPLPMQRTDPFNPPEEYGRLRAESPVSRFAWPNGVQAWLVTRHEDVRAALADSRLSVDRTASPPPSLAKGRSSGVMLPRVARLRPQIEKIVADYLDRMERTGSPADLVSSFTLPIPSMVICELLGVPPDDRTDFQRHTEIISSVNSAAEHVQEATSALMSYMGELITAKRRSPGDDILSHLAQATIDGVPVGDDGLLGNGMLLLIAGHETTSNMMALSVATLLTHPDQLHLIQADPALIDRAVEELLRFHVVIQYGVVRRATADLIVGGQQVRAGDWVVCSLASANRDRALCQAPGQFQAGREPVAHTSFGYGIHQCAGQHLARLELRIALSALFGRFPGLRLAEPAERLPFRTDMFVYGLHKLLLQW
jgi:cytochrome P450